jgi:head-tail adaptor
VGYVAGETVTVLRATATTDAHGNVVRAWADAEEHQVSGVAVNPREVNAENGGREASEDLFVLYMPAGADVLASDRVRVRGEVYDVDGTPKVWRSPFTARHPGVEVHVRRVVG